MQVDWVVTCRYAESDGSVATIVGAGIDVLYVAGFPHEVGIMVAVRLSAPFEEVSADQGHQLIGRILGPDGAPVRARDGSAVAPLELDLHTTTGASQLVPGWLATPLHAIGLQWWAPHEGTYTIEIGVDDEEPTLTPVHVLQGST